MIKKLYYELSLKHFFKTLNVPNKFVLKTRVGFFFEASIAGSAQIINYNIKFF